MGLVRHEDGCRRVWMFPRNIRSIPPWKMAQILSLLIQQAGSREWRSQDIQNDFCKALEKAGLKRPGTQYDPQSGGPRTYLSQLRCLGLVFDRNGELFPTIAGEDLVSGRTPLKIMQKLLLRHQYPSAYSSGQNVRINPRIRIKPFLFILQLLNEPGIVNLNQEELCIPLMYGHNQDCIEICIEKIISLRKGKSLYEVIDDPTKDLYLPRSSDSDMKARISNIKNIGNTCKNYMKSCCLVSEERVGDANRIFFNEDVRDSYESELSESERFIEDLSEESFLRRYGAWNRSKDNRSLTSAHQIYEKDAGRGIVIASFYEYCGHDFVSDMPDEFIERMSGDYGFSRAQVQDFIEPLLPRALDYFESTFIEASTGGRELAARFELGLVALFEKKLGFFAKHTGPLNRRGVGGFSDVFIASDRFGACAIIDAKAAREYSLSSDDYAKMVSNYIPNYRELTNMIEETRNKDVKLEFAAYTAGGFSGSIGGRLSEIKRETGVRCSAVRARDLLSLAKTGISKDSFWRVMSKGSLLSMKDFIADSLA